MFLLRKILGGVDLRTSLTALVELHPHVDSSLLLPVILLPYRSAKARLWEAHCHPFERALARGRKGIFASLECRRPRVKWWEELAFIERCSVLRETHALQCKSVSLETHLQFVNLSAQLWLKIDTTLGRLARRLTSKTRSTWWNWDLVVEGKASLWGDKSSRRWPCRGCHLCSLEVSASWNAWNEQGSTCLLKCCAPALLAEVAVEAFSAACCDIHTPELSYGLDRHVELHRQFVYMNALKLTHPCH